LNQYAPVVTLSNVSCLDSDRRPLQALLDSDLKAHHPSCELGYSKPDSRAFESIAALHSISLPMLIHIGDHWECDTLGALSAGAQAVWISGGRDVPHHDPHNYLGRLSVVDDLSEAAERMRTLTEVSLDRDRLPKG
jgi:FMN phosphatase YigB (HAD superfamily)